MKKLFNINLIVLVLSTNIIQVYGQWNNNFPCTNGVNTNPNNPTNNGLPTLPNGSSDTRFLNKFDWIHGNDTWIDPVDGSVNHTYQTHGMFFNENQCYASVCAVCTLGFYQSKCSV